ncbi:MAG TPA: CvpA family protein [Aggregatilineales bacterium]|nr:CvpA family protein [Aggregatilineales bacterium]
MMELSFFLRLCVMFFAVMGYLRGIYKEFVGLAGIVLSLFLITQFDWVLDLFLGSSSASVRFAAIAILLIVLTFFSYQQAPTVFAPSRYRTGRGIRLPSDRNWQTNVLGALFGGINGYLVVGSLWYFMDQFEYPMDSLFLQPAVGSTSASFVTNLPLVWLQQANLLMWLVMGLFLLIIIFR